MTSSPASATEGFRADIQGLRAVAVLLVLLYHLWPAAVPGGYVGVDVFFVISGYLITGMLVREAERSDRVSLSGFYVRRMGRLLPAATATLVVVAVLSFALLPPLRWQDTAAEIAASTFYFENWLLIGKSVDYLASASAASPVQHFWSLSVEEQFYIVWPLVILAALWLARRTGWPRRRVLWAALLILAAASLACSIIATARMPVPAYFSSATRFWELALGGLLCLWLREPGAARSGQDHLVWPGLLAIAVSAAWYSDLTEFPGYAALLPTLGAAAVIHAGASARPGLGSGLLGLRPLRYLGGISYSLYLWHWPLILFYQVRTGAGLGVGEGLAILVVSIVLAHLSKKLIEDPIRGARSLRSPAWRTFAMGGGAAAVSAALAAALYVRGAPSDVELEEVPSADHPGALALARGYKLKPAPIIPTPLDAFHDRGHAYGGHGAQRCIQNAKGSGVLVCHYGPRDARVTIALVGDSHAANWEPAFERLAVTRGWHVIGYIKDSCAFADVTIFYRGFGRGYTECDEWRETVLRRLLANKPDLVVVAQYPRHALTAERDLKTSVPVIVEGLRRTWHELARAGIPVAVMRHTPIQSDRVLECMSAENPSVKECSARRRRALTGGPLDQAARDNPDVRLIDMTDQFCGKRRCPVVIGNILVYRDGSHITATYSRTLAAALEARLVAQFPSLGAPR
ncbi:MAG TPA: acyltransferase family protein [Kofleriaceae bacterium]|nr:acyltransferase family protein [Kofleriaceae bacterium]